MAIHSLQSKGDGPPSAIEARLLETRRKLVGLAKPADPLTTENAAGPSTITHPFYDNHSRNFDRSSIQSTIADLQKGLKSFLSDASRENSSDASNVYPSNGTDFTIAVGAEGGTDTEALKKSNDRKSLLVSLLREQSNHSLAVSRIRDDLDSLIGGEEMKSVASLEALMICALSLEDNVANSWPTNNLEDASKGLDDAVHAFESIAKEMQLESFADQHESSSISGTEQQRRAKEYTITFAARILVIDVDLTLEQDNQIWVPKSKVRISYATDSSNGNDANRFRNANLAELLGKDVQAIAAAIFGCTEGDRRKDAARHLGRLQSTVKALKRLDDLSETVTVSGYPDLFALMEDIGTEKLSNCISSSNTNDKIISRQHDGYSYATILLHGSTTSELREEAESKTYMLRLDIGNSTLIADANTDDDEMKLPKLQTSKEDPSLQFLIRLEPALGIGLQDVRRISKIIGLEPKEGLAKSNTYSQDDNLVKRIGLFRLAQTQFSQIEVEEEEEAVYVNCIPIASFKQLSEILPILQEQVILNEITSSIQAGAGQNDEEQLTTQSAKVSFNRSENRKPIIRIRIDLEGEPSKTLSVSLQRLDEEWLLEGGLADNDGNTIQTLTTKDATHIAALLEQPKSGLRGAIESLREWAAEGAFESSAPVVKRLKRRSSEAGLSEGNADSVRPTNRPRNEDA
ncbi:uncharacterized protein FA14DRAFT_179175 [Meira miltonrushii]|uniref:Mediator of RNA polymerase II transcription subunit 1 n=1 Tax=Meira miltonrushii TaxID=1280837 RepID=A0A316VDQ1_9BASI|nr:uncharacterized protein FA14DRAFT_179175 [Meira miltonrushii]PWN35807.1 hypothetical protein FA14DRAFT_179175 [Meira miltonrushii]